MIILRQHLDYLGIKITSDVDFPAYRKIDERFKMTAPMGNGVDPRSPVHLRHSMVEMIRQRGYRLRLDMKMVSIPISYGLTLLFGCQPARIKPKIRPWRTSRRGKKGDSLHPGFLLSQAPLLGRGVQRYRPDFPANGHRHPRQYRLRQDLPGQDGPLTVAALFNDWVLPFCDVPGLTLLRALTDNGTE